MLTNSFIDVENEASDLGILAAAMLNKSAATDRALVYMGLESTTAISAQISEEGIGSWILNKIESLGRKIWILVNRIYARLTGSSAATKALIEKAKAGEDVKLPISPRMAGHVLSAGTVLLTALGLLVAFKAGDGHKLDRVIENCKAVFDNMSSENQKSEAGQNMKRNIENDEKKLSRNYAYKFAVALNGLYQKIMGPLKKFLSKINFFKSEAKSAGNNNSESKSLWSRIKDLGSYTVKVFSLLRKWFAKIPSMFRGKSKAEPKLLPKA